MLIEQLHAEVRFFAVDLTQIFKVSFEIILCHELMRYHLRPDVRMYIFSLLADDHFLYDRLRSDDISQTHTRRQHL